MPIKIPGAKYLSVSFSVDTILFVFVGLARYETSRSFEFPLTSGCFKKEHFIKTLRLLASRRYTYSKLLGN